MPSMRMPRCSQSVAPRLEGSCQRPGGPAAPEERDRRQCRRSYLAEERNPPAATDSKTGVLGNVIQHRGPRQDAGQGRGSHQLARPSSSIIAGTSTRRTSVASISTATARPSPISLTETSAAEHELTGTRNHDRAAAVITRAVRASRRATAAAVVAGARRTPPGSATAGTPRSPSTGRTGSTNRNIGTQVVDRHLLRERRTAGATSPTGRSATMHAVGGADRQQVHHRRLERHHDRPEHHQSSSIDRAMTTRDQPAAAAGPTMLAKVTLPALGPVT